MYIYLYTWVVYTVLISLRVRLKRRATYVIFVHGRRHRGRSISRARVVAATNIIRGERKAAPMGRYFRIVVRVVYGNRRAGCPLKRIRWPRDIGSALRTTTSLKTAVAPIVSSSDRFAVVVTRDQRRARAYCNVQLRAYPNENSPESPTTPKTIRNLFSSPYVPRTAAYMFRRVIRGL